MSLVPGRGSDETFTSLMQEMYTGKFKVSESVFVIFTVVFQ